MAILSREDHVVELVNKAYYHLVGKRDILRKPLRIALPEMVDQGHIKLLDEVFHTGRRFIGKEMKVQLQVTANETLVERYVDIIYQARKNTAGDIIGIFAHGVDVTDLVILRQQNEERARYIKRYAKTFDVALSNITDFVYIFDREGRFTYANQPFLDLIGITFNDLVGKNFDELPYPPDLAATLHAHIAQVVATGEQVYAEARYVNPAGTEGYFDYIFSPVVTDDGEVTVVAGSTRDVTERVRRDQQKDEFLGIVSHELKTPVTSIKAYVQLLKKHLEKEGNATAVTRLGKMEGQINKLIALISDLLDLTKINHGQLQFTEAPFAFDALVIEAIEEVQLTSEQHLIISEGVTNQRIMGDKDRLSQVLTNLLTNAIKYSPNADTIRVTSVTDGKTVTLTVQDFGIGIGAQHLPHVFERFYRAAADEQTAIDGLGLGLYVSANIIQRHGGSMGVESVKGQSTTFRFRLPVQQDDKTSKDEHIPPELTAPLHYLMTSSFSRCFVQFFPPYQISAYSGLLFQSYWRPRSAR